MKILVVGGGGREHALVWKLAQSSRGGKIYCAPGNAGTAKEAENVDIKATDVQALADFASREKMDLTVVGPESPLIAGLADEFHSRGLRIFGPTSEGAKIEGSKAWAKELMKEAGVPTAAYDTFTELAPALERSEAHFAENNTPLVIKADGEAAGKGVFITRRPDEAREALKTILEQRAFGKSGDLVVIEDYLSGQEATLMSFVCGESFAPMPAAQDYKRAYDNDEGPNTGGMGCYSPVPVVTPEVYETAVETIIKPTLKALARRGIDYRGILYTGLVLTQQGPKVLEFNCRFGDPETQVVLPLLESDLLDVIEMVVDGKLDSQRIKWYNSRAVCVVVASGGYPGDYETGKPIHGLPEAASAGAIVFHAGTKIAKTVGSGQRCPEPGALAVDVSGQGCPDTNKTVGSGHPCPEPGAVAVDASGQGCPDTSNVSGMGFPETTVGVVTAGGRVLGVTGVGENYGDAVDIAYRAVESIRFDNMHYRKDIGARVR